MKLFVILAICLFGCDDSTIQNENIRNLVTKTSQRMRYIKDEETKLCFAVSYFSDNPVMVNVPCTDDVERKTYY